MANVQPTYTETIRPAVAGQRANMEPVDLFSGSVEDVAGIGFGKVVAQGTGDAGITATLTSLDAYTFKGITMRERGITPEFPNGWAQGEEALIMRKGVIWVEVAGAVAAGTDVTVTTASGVLGSASVGAGVVAIPNARWETSTAGAGLAQLRLG